MREGIHPEYYQAKVTCNCGNSFVTGSTKEEIHVEICSKCHPFYTGQVKATQARGRVEAFNRKYSMGDHAKPETKKAEPEVTEKVEEAAEAVEETVTEAAETVEEAKAEE